MTDEQIIRALECCTNDEDWIKACKKCPLTEECKIGNGSILDRYALDLIKRSKKEIERLKRKNTILSKNADTAFQDGLDESRDLFKKEIEPEIRNEAIKEFAKRLCKGRVENDPVVIAVKSELKRMASELKRMKEARI